jgi:hypothetical protein
MNNNLKDQGWRFILRPVNGQIDGHWRHPSDIPPGGLDCTDMDDDTFANEVQKLRQWLERRREQV